MTSIMRNIFSTSRHFPWGHNGLARGRKARIILEFDCHCKTIEDSLELLEGFCAGMVSSLPKSLKEGEVTAVELISVHATIEK